MDVIIQLVGGGFFLIKVDFFDTVLQMKQKIQNYTSIPVAYQALAFEGNLLLDYYRSVSSCFISHGSCVQLYILDTPLPQSHPPIHAQLHVRLHTANFLNPPVNVYLTDSVLHLRQILHQTYGLPSDGLGLFVDARRELTGNNPPYEYGVSNGSVIDVFIRAPQPAPNLSVSNNNPPLLASSSSTSGNMPLPPPLPLSSSSATRNMPPVSPSSTSASRNMPPLPTSSSSGFNKLRIQVLTPCQKKLNLEVNPTAKVRVLRDELQKLQQQSNIELSPQGYFFIHRRKQMEEEASFISNNVQWDDEIAVFNATVS